MTRRIICFQKTTRHLASSAIFLSSSFLQTIDFYWILPFLEISEVPTDVMTQETEIFRELALKESSGKSKKPEILEKMITGKVNKRLAEICLLEQSHVAVQVGCVVPP